MKTLAEYDAMAMLLGLSYDQSDHTFYKGIPPWGNNDIVILDADTLEDVSGTCTKRTKLVSEGKLGIRYEKD